MCTSGVFLGGHLRPVLMGRGPGGPASPNFWDLLRVRIHDEKRQPNFAWLSN